MDKTATRIAGSAEKIFTAWRLIREDIIRLQADQRQRSPSGGRRSSGSRVATDNGTG